MLHGSSPNTSEQRMCLCARLPSLPPQRAQSGEWSLLHRTCAAGSTAHHRQQSAGTPVLAHSDADCAVQHTMARKPLRELGLRSPHTAQRGTIAFISGYSDTRSVHGRCTVAKEKIFGTCAAGGQTSFYKSQPKCFRCGFVTADINRPTVNCRSGRSRAWWSKVPAMLAYSFVSVR